MLVCQALNALATPQWRAHILVCKAIANGKVRRHRTMQGMSFRVGLRLRAPALLQDIPIIACELPELPYDAVWKDLVARKRWWGSQMIIADCTRKRPPSTCMQVT